MLVATDNIGNWLLFKFEIKFEQITKIYLFL